MKNITKLKTVVSLLLIFGSSYTNAQITKAEIRATGLTCSMCSNAINKQLKSLVEVLNVETDLNTNTFTVTLKENNELNPKIFKDKVEKAGFFIGSLTITARSEIISKNPYVLVNNKKSGATETQFQVVDKGYVTDKEFKKLSKTYKDISTYVLNSEDDFHIKILN
jgi:copper chaperone CopZ